jgi:hypothetical protein
MTDESPAVPPKNSFNFAGFLSKIGIFLLNLVLPVLISGGLLLIVAALLNLWKYDRTFSNAVFVFLLVFLSLVLSIFISGFRRKKVYRSRLVILVLGGLLIPIAAFAGANLLMIAPGESYMARVITLSVSQTVDVSMAQLGSTVIASKSVYTKVEGIKAIGAIHSPAGLEQLFLVLNTDPAALANGAVADALSKAFASYGLDAKPGLLAAFQKHTQTGESIAGSPSAGLYERYFAQALDGLQAEMNAQPLSEPAKQDQLQQLSALAGQIKATVNDLQSKALLAGGDPLVAFVLDTFLQMNLASEDSLLAFARTSAADTRLPDGARVKALLLVARLGGKDDMPLFYQYLTNSSEVIKAGAFDAIAGLTLKLNGPAKTK